MLACDEQTIAVHTEIVCHQMLMRKPQEVQEFCTADISQITSGKYHIYLAHFMMGNKEINGKMWVT